ncbi:MAG: serine hydrolase domain-containing protein [Gemmatimonadota bacterium]|nr:serine hydrolase domain-containing protein [Gemmatimonadota bacterium]
MPSILWSLCVLVPLWLVTAPPIGAQETALSRLDEVVQPALERVPGLAVAVGEGGEIVHSRAYGRATLDPFRPMTPETRLRVYSVSKPWTVAAALRLVEEGRLNPASSIGSILPELPEHLASITPEQLATHASGIRHYEGEEASMDRRCDTVEDALGIFVDDPLLFPPGTDRAYSTWGFVLLGAVIEEAAGEPFAGVVRAQVLEPAGMDATVHAASAGDEAIARAYERDGEGFEDVSGTTDPSCKWGGGGYLATAEDLARFPMAVTEGLLPPDFARLLFERQEGSVNRAGGSGPGGSSFVRTDLESGLVVALAANAGGALEELRQVADAIAAVYAEE